MKRAIALVLLMAAPASAHGFGSGCPEGAEDIEYARSLHQLDCASLDAVVEGQRQFTNRRAHAFYHRWAGVPVPAPLVAAPTAAPSVTIPALPGPAGR